MLGLDEITSKGYDDLYRQIDFCIYPFGCNKEHTERVRTKVNSEIVLNLKSGKVLDVGGGYGYLKNFLFDNQFYYNIEYSKEIQKWDESDNKIIGSGLQLPFKDNTFENVVSGDVLEHVPDKKLYLEECYRVLKKDGTFVINTPTRGTPAHRFYSSLWYYFFILSALCWKVYHNLSKKPNNYMQLNVPRGVMDEPSDERWLYSLLNKLGYTIVIGRRTAILLPFGLSGKLYSKIVDNFIDEDYGNSMLFVCKKEINRTRSKSFDSLCVISKRDSYFRRTLYKFTKKLVTTLNITD